MKCSLLIFFSFFFLAWPEFLCEPTQVFTSVLFSVGEKGISLPCSSIEQLSSQICMPEEDVMKSRFNSKDAQDCIS